MSTTSETDSFVTNTVCLTSRGVSASPARLAESITSYSPGASPSNANRPLASTLVDLYVAEGNTSAVSLLLRRAETDNCAVFGNSPPSTLTRPRSTPPGYVSTSRTSAMRCPTPSSMGPRCWIPLRSTRQTVNPAFEEESTTPSRTFPDASPPMWKPPLLSTADKAGPVTIAPSDTTNAAILNCASLASRSGSLTPSIAATPSMLPPRLAVIRTPPTSAFVTSKVTGSLLRSASPDVLKET